MTRLYYSSLPPEAQEAIKKLTGYTDEELEGKVLRQTDAHTIKIGKSKPQSLKTMLYQVAIPLTIILIIFGIVWLVSYLATH